MLVCDNERTLYQINMVSFLRNGSTTNEESVIIYLFQTLVTYFLPLSKTSELLKNILVTFSRLGFKSTMKVSYKWSIWLLDYILSLLKAFDCNVYGTDPFTGSVWSGEWIISDQFLNRIAWFFDKIQLKRMTCSQTGHQQMFVMLFCE